MSTSVARLSTEATSVEFVGDSVRVLLANGREISAPLAWSPRLRDASDAQHANWRLIGRRGGVHWPDLDEDVSVNSLLGLPTRACGRKGAASRVTVETIRQALLC
jgi:hypothetical protein